MADTPDTLERQFFEELRLAAYIYETANEYLGAFEACRAVAQHINRRGHGPEMAIPFMRIAEAFHALDRGQKPSLFQKRAEREKERPHSPERERHRRVAAAMLEVLVSVANDALQTAAAGIARDVQRWPGIGREQVTANTIINWRKQLSRKKDKHYLEIVKHALEDSDPVGSVNFHLKRLRGPNG